MSAKAQLLEAVARVPENVALEILTQIQPWLEPRTESEPANPDYFQSYWSQFYGIIEGAEWPEPGELPFEQRAVW